jgi:hypothetical protein
MTGRRPRARRFARYSGSPASLATLSSQPVVIARARIPKSTPESSRAAATMMASETSLLRPSATVL